MEELFEKVPSIMANALAKNLGIEKPEWFSVRVSTSIPTRTLTIEVSLEDEDEEV